MRYVHRDVQENPVVAVVIKFQGQKHRAEASVSPCLTHPVIPGTNWPGFWALAQEMLVDDNAAVVRHGVECAQCWMERPILTDQGTTLSYELFKNCTNYSGLKQFAPVFSI